jgi:hypothetical protein
MASVPSIRIDLSSGGAGTTGQSRTDAVNAETVTLVDSANASGSYTWTLVAPDGSSSTLSSSTAASPIFTIDVAHGSYLIFCEVDGVRSYSEDATGAKVSTQGGLAVLENGFRKPVAGETTQFDSDEGWSKTLDDLLDDITGLYNPTQGEIAYANSSGEWAVLAPGTNGQVLTTAGAAADPTWEDAASGSGDVTASANIDDLAIVVGDGGAKGVKGNGGGLGIGATGVLKGIDGVSEFYLGAAGGAQNWLRASSTNDNEGTIFQFSTASSTSHNADDNGERGFFWVVNHGVNFPGGAGAIGKNRSSYFEFPVLSADAAQTVTEAATLAIDGAPSAGANMTITNPYALWVEAGLTQLDGGLAVTGNISVSGTVDGRDIATDGTKLDGIESLADVTDATNVNAAGAVMHSDISVSDGYLLKTGSETYTAIKTNRAASAAPAVTDDSDDGYAVGSIWIDTTGGAAYICVDESVGAADWNQIDGAGGAGDVSGPGSSTDTAIAVWSGVGGDTLADTGVKIDGSNIMTTPGVIRGPDGTITAPAFSFTGNTQIGMFRAGSELHLTPNGGTTSIKIATTTLYSNGIALGAPGAPWTNEFLSGYLNFGEMSAPTGVASKAIVFAQDNGAGKTQLMVVFGDDTPQELAIEP